METLSVRMVNVFGSPEGFEREQLCFINLRGVIALAERTRGYLFTYRTATSQR